MTAPYRFQLKRAAGWRKPPGGIACGRPSRWSNPYIIGQPVPIGGCTPPGQSQWPKDKRLDFPTAVRLFEADLLLGANYGLVRVSTDEVREHLAGHPLGCWCPAEARCHVEPLFRIANDWPPDEPVPFRGGKLW